MNKFILAGLLLLPPFQAQAQPKESALLVAGVLGTTIGCTKLLQKESEEQMLGLIMIATFMIVILNADNLAKV